MPFFPFALFPFAIWNFPLSTKVAQANITDAVKDLRFRWERARSEWDDAASRRFEKDVLAPLEPMVVAAMKALEHVNELMIQVRRDCEDHGND